MAACTTEIVIAVSRIPITAAVIARMRPPHDSGAVSPYPTVVIVAITSHRLSPKPRGASESPAPSSNQSSTVCCR